MGTESPVTASTWPVRFSASGGIPQDMTAETKSRTTDKNWVFDVGKEMKNSRN
jgi:hypothetical protein